MTSSMLERFTAIIDVFDGPAVSLSLDQVASGAGLPRSTTHRILDQLVGLNWVAHADRGYRLGRRAMCWGAADAADVRLREAAAPVLHHLQIATSAVVHLGVFDDGYIVHIDKLGGSGAAQIPTRVGLRLPAHRVALGMAVLAALPPEQVTASLDPAVGTELLRIRRTGLAHRHNDYTTGWSSVAATINRRAALGIVLPDNISAQRHLAVLRAAAARVNDALPSAFA
jgi:DNA-binding IclR family transcriptional regulator